MGLLYLYLSLLKQKISARLKCYLPEYNADTHHHKSHKFCVKVAIIVVYDDFVSVAGAYNLLSCENYCGELQTFEQCRYLLCWKD
jgi:hypothetical protein